MSTMNLQELFELARDNAALLFRENGVVLPIWHAVSGQNEHSLIATPWGSDEEKTETVESLRCLFAAVGVRRFAFIAEVWLVQVRDADIDTRPSEHQDRREALRIHAEDRDGSTMSGHFYILRPEHGSPTLSPFHKDPDNLISTGRLMGMLI